MVISWGEPAPAADPRPKSLEAALTFCIFEYVTAPEEIVVAKLPVPEPVTSLVSVIVWSPVLEPDDVPECVPAIDVVPVTVSAGVDAPVMVTPLMEVAVAAPNVGVVRVGEVAFT